MVESIISFSSLCDEDFDVLTERIRNLFYSIRPEIDYEREVSKSEFWGIPAYSEEIYPRIKVNETFTLNIFVNKFHDAEDLMDEIQNIDVPYQYINISTSRNEYSLELTPKIEIENLYPKIIVQGRWELSV
jgi:hypothetical protein